MTYFQSALLVIFGVIGYMIIVDENVAVFIDLLFKMTKVNIEKFYWMIRYHPNNFITTWIQNRKYDKISRELEREFNDRQKK